MKVRLLAAGIAALALSGCTNNAIIPSFPSPEPVEVPKVPVVEETQTDYEHASPEKQKLFQEDMIAVATSTKSDPNYHRMALDTPERKAWFKNLMYRLWDGQITKQQFIDEGVTKYHDHRYEFEFVANGFEQRR